MLFVEYPPCTTCQKELSSAPLTHLYFIDHPMQYIRMVQERSYMLDE